MLHRLRDVQAIPEGRTPTFWKIMSISQEIELDLERMALGGSALGRLPTEDGPGLVVFVERGLPGQRVRVRLEKRAKRHAVAQLLEVLGSGEGEIPPPCPHFGECGGCMWQHLEYGRQLEWKRDFLAEALRRIGDVRNRVVHATTPSPEQYGYRNKMEFAFSGQGADLRLGLRPRKGSAVLDTPGCLLMRAPAMEVVAAVRDACAAAGLAAWNSDTGGGFLRHFVLRHADSQGRELLGQLITADVPGLKDSARQVCETLHAGMPFLLGVAHSVRRSAVPIAVGQRTPHVSGHAVCRFELHGLTLEAGVNSFFQTNTGSAAALFTLVRDMARPVAGEVIWDVYCGVGGLGLYVAREAGGDCRLRGFEISQEAVSWAEANSRSNSLGNCRFISGDVVRTLPRERGRPDLVLLDPPRAGLDPELIRHLLERRPKRMVYVSCDPATQARDLKLLLPDYALVEARPLDMFPQTPHVESVALLHRRR